LILNHAYALTDLFTIADPKSREEFRMLRLRNPWGKSEWNGAWSADSEEAKKYRP
jgi:hypothetical protein